MYKRRTVEILLEKISVREDESPAGKGGNRRMLVGRLIWPRSTIAERVSVRALDFNKGACDLHQEKWSDRILFKETVQGTYGLHLGLSGEVTDNQIGHFLKYAAGSIFGIAGKEAEDLSSSTLGAGIAGIPFKYLKSLLSGADNDVDFVGEAVMDLDADGSNGKEIRLSLPLSARETLYRTERKQKGGELESRKRILYREGEANGEVVIVVRCCD